MTPSWTRISARLPAHALGAAALLAALAGCAGQQQPPPRRGWHAMRGGPGGAPGDHDAGGGGFRRALFISPMGEPFRGPGPREALVRAWFDGADADHDGRLTLTEFRADAERFFATLDVNHDGEIDPAEIERYETEIAPEIRVGGYAGAMGGRSGGGGGGHHGRGGGGRRGGMGGGGGGGGSGGESGSDSSGAPQPTEPTLQGAARFGFFPYPEPVTAADADFNRGVSRAEFAAAAGQRFIALDSTHTGSIRFEDLPPLPSLRR